MKKKCRAELGVEINTTLKKRKKKVFLFLFVTLKLYRMFFIFVSLCESNKFSIKNMFRPSLMVYNQKKYNDVIFYVSWNKPKQIVCRL